MGLNSYPPEDSSRAKNLPLNPTETFFAQACEFIQTHFNLRCVQIWTMIHNNEPILRSSASSPDFTVEDRQMRSVLEKCLSPRTPIVLAAGSSNQVTVPLRVNGNLLGILLLESNSGDAFSPKNLNAIESTALLIATFMAHLQLFEQAKHSSQFFQALLECADDQAILSTDTNGFVLTASTGSPKIFGLPQKNILGRDILTLFTSTSLQNDLAIYITNPVSPTLVRKNVSQQKPDIKTKAYYDVTFRLVREPGAGPVGFFCLVQDVSQILNLQKQQALLTLTDDLTGLFNQRHLFQTLSAEIERSRRFGHCFSICFFDLDHFKEYNDIYGHLKGSRALKDVANILRINMRHQIDSCYRYGGDEFMTIMPETTVRQATRVIEKIQSGINEFFEAKITGSFGIVESQGYDEPKKLLEKADQTMYLAKSKGRNCIVSSP